MRARGMPWRYVLTYWQPHLLVGPTTGRAVDESHHQLHHVLADSRSWVVMCRCGRRCKFIHTPAAVDPGRIAGVVTDLIGSVRRARQAMVSPGTGTHASTRHRGLRSRTQPGSSGPTFRPRAGHPSKQGEEPSSPSVQIPQLHRRQHRPAQDSPQPDRHFSGSCP